MCAVINAVKADDAGPVTQLPVVTVTEPALREEAGVGPNNQPAWTTDGRLGSTTRAYVLPPWHVELTQWWRPEAPRGGSPKHLFQEEIEIGLPYRFQLDLYENWELTSDGYVRHAANQVEVRWALAEWGRIPFNPTLYAEWKFNNAAADTVEMKLLLSEVIAPRWHWGVNFTWEQQVGDGRETEFAVSQALSYTLVDEKLSAGVEMKFEHKTEQGSRSDAEIEFLIGPSIEWKPTTRTTLSVAPLFGVTDDSPHVQAFVIFSIGLGRESEGEARVPVSLKGN